MVGYYAKIEYDNNEKVFNVSFPNLEGCYTFGNTLEEALIYAKDALNGYLSVILNENMEMEEQNITDKNNLYFIKPDRNISFVILLKKRRKELGLTQQQVAEMLNISYQAYQRYENTDKCNPTLKKIAKLEKVLNREIVTV